MLRFIILSWGVVAAGTTQVCAQTAALASITQSGGGGALVAAKPAVVAKPAVYFTAEQMPGFPGGGAAMGKFLSSRLIYPAPALERNVSGKVHVTFTVDPEGRLHDPQVVRGLGFGLDEEALRLVRLMPWWTPGQVQGQPVWVSMTLPIVFRAL